LHTFKRRNATAPPLAATLILVDVVVPCGGWLAAERLTSAGWFLRPRRNLTTPPEFDQRGTAWAGYAARISGVVRELTFISGARWSEFPARLARDFGASGAVALFQKWVNTLCNGLKGFCGKTTQRNSDIML